MEFEVENCPPPKFRTGERLWNDDKETKNVMRLREKAFEVYQNKLSMSGDVKLTIEISIPEKHRNDHLKAGDLDNFIKGICDSISKRLPADDTFNLHDDYSADEYKHLWLGRFGVIEDDEQIIEIHAKKEFGVSEVWFYRIRIEEIPS